MATKKNIFIDDEDLSEITSLTHLLDRHNDNDNTDEIQLLKHSQFYSDEEFSKLLSAKNGFSVLKYLQCFHKI